MRVIYKRSSGLTARQCSLFALVGVLIISLVSIFAPSAEAARFTQRSLQVNSSSAGRYSITFALPSSGTVGSIKINSGISGLDLRYAVPVTQTGISGFQLVQQQTPTEIILTRTPGATGTQTNTFVFENLTTGPTATANFTLRLSTYSNRGATGFMLHDINVSAVRATTNYAISFGFPGSASVGALRLELCSDPVPDLDCTTIPGLDVSNAALTSQTGETGFSISSQNSNTIILSRSPSSTGSQINTYVLDNVQNPSFATTFYIRITSWAASNPSPTARSGYIDYGGVVSAATDNIGLQTQVPPVLVFCVGLDITSIDCNNVEGGNFVDFGELETDQTYSAQSQIVSRTNAQDGYTISIHGIGVTAGNKTIPSLEEPTLSATGNSQFGLNLVSNSSPVIGEEQSGPGLNAIINPDYAQADKFMFRSGDTILSVTGVSSFKRYTVSYILNASPDQPPGVYAATVTYVSSGFF